MGETGGRHMGKMRCVGELNTVDELAENACEMAERAAAVSGEGG